MPATTCSAAARAATALYGGPGDDQVLGGDGRSFFRGLCDRLHGGPGNDRIAGGRGRDRMSGGRGDDVQTGGGGADLIFANRGADQSWGGEGADVLWALSRYDVAALGDPVGDELNGEAGTDRFRVRDGEVDKVTAARARTACSPTSTTRSTPTASS